MDLPWEIVVPAAVAVVGVAFTAIRAFVGSSSTPSTHDTPDRRTREQDRQREADEFLTEYRQRRNRGRTEEIPIDDLVAEYLGTQNRTRTKTQPPKTKVDPTAKPETVEEAIALVENNHRKSRYSATVLPEGLKYDWVPTDVLVMLDDVRTTDENGDTVFDMSPELEAVYDLYAKLRSTWLSEAIPQYRQTLLDRMGKINDQFEKDRARQRTVDNDQVNAQVELNRINALGEDEFDEAASDSYQRNDRKLREAKQELRVLSKAVKRRQQELGRLKADLRELDRHSLGADLSVAAKPVLMSELFELLRIDGAYAVGTTEDGVLEVRFRKKYRYGGTTYDFGDWAIRVGNPAWPYPKFKCLHDPTQEGENHPYFHYWEGSEFCIGSTNEQVRDLMVKGNLITTLMLVSTTLGHANQPGQVPYIFKPYKERPYN